MRVSSCATTKMLVLAQKTCDDPSRTVARPKGGRWVALDDTLTSVAVADLDGMVGDVAADVKHNLGWREAGW
jgi:hypothetical protein